MAISTRDIRVLTDEQLIEVHEKAQREVAYLIHIDCTNLAVTWARTARRAEKEILRRHKYYRKTGFIAWLFRITYLKGKENA
jgi:hypothetical protein